MQGQLCTEPIEVIFDPGALVMNLTQIVVEKWLYLGVKLTYPRSQMNDSFWVKNDFCQGQTRKWPQHRVVNDYIEGQN